MRELLRRLFRRKRLDDEVLEEMESHLAMREEHHRETGMSSDDARQAAIRRFGNRSAIRETIYENNGFGVVEALLKEVRCALRSLRRRPAFSALVILMIALGSAAATTTFALVDAVLLRPLPYKDPDRLVSVWVTYPNRKDLPSWDSGWFSYPEYEDLRDHGTLFERVSLTKTFEAPLITDAEPRRIAVGRTDSALLPMLGVEPRIGRLFTTDDDKKGAERTVLLSYALWQQDFGGEEAVLEKSLRLEEAEGVIPYTIIGVLPRNFHFTVTGFTAAASYVETEPQVWVPVTSRKTEDFNNRGNHSFTVTARLRHDVPVSAAEAEVQRIVSDTSGAHGPDLQHGARIMTRFRHETGTARGSLLVLFASSGLLLLIASGNIANLMLGESFVREREIAVRTALGASPLRVTSQLVVESILLSVAGGMIGIVSAIWATRLLVQWSPAQIPRLHEIAVDLRVFSIMFAVVVVSGLLFGIAPARALLRSGLEKALGERQQGPTFARNLAARLIVVLEIGLSFVLLVSAGLLTRSFLALNAVDPGLRADHLLAVRPDPPYSRYRGRFEAFYRETVEQLRALPGVESATGISVLPFGVGASSTFVQSDEMVARSSLERPDAYRRMIFPNYFETVGTPVIAGRAFKDADDVENSDAVIVNKALARLLWPGESAIDKRLHADNRSYNVVGVVDDVRERALDEPAKATFYRPQSTNINDMTFVLRTSGDPWSIAGSAKEVIRRIDKDMAFSLVDTVANRISASLAESRYRASLIGIFAAAAAFLSAIGLYGIMSRSVTERRRELAVRAALGAESGDILAMVVRQTFRLTCAGLMLGCVASTALTRVLSSVLFHLTPLDPATYLAIAVLLCGIALLASWIPARRALRIDPVIALK